MIIEKNISIECREQVQLLMYDTISKLVVKVFTQINQETRKIEKNKPLVYMPPVHQLLVSYIKR